MKNGPGHVKLRDIAKEVCISENHMNHIFKSVTGTTIANYIEKLRIDLAKQLLIETTISIDHISSKLGYYDRYHFGKSFKKATGLSRGATGNTCDIMSFLLAFKSACALCRTSCTRICPLKDRGRDRSRIGGALQEILVTQMQQDRGRNRRRQCVAGCAYNTKAAGPRREPVSVAHYRKYL